MLHAPYPKSSGPDSQSWQSNLCFRPLVTHRTATRRIFAIFRGHITAVLYRWRKESKLQATSRLSITPPPVLFAYVPPQRRLRYYAQQLFVTTQCYPLVHYRIESSDIRLSSSKMSLNEQSATLRAKRASLRRPSSSSSRQTLSSFFIRALPYILSSMMTFVILYHIVRACTAPTTPRVVQQATNSAASHRPLGYVLLMIGYLLVPGVAGLLVQRRKTVALQRAMVEGSADGGGLDVIGCNSWIGSRRGRAFDRAVQETKWDGECKECCVCLGEVEKGMNARVVSKCGHVFHAQCLKGWVVGVGRNACPMCSCSVVNGKDGGLWKGRWRMWTTFSLSD